MRIAIILNSILLAVTTWSAPYQKITAEIPSYLPPGVKDSVLIALVPPAANLQEVLSIDSVAPCVWLRITVAQQGYVDSSEVVAVSHPNLGLEPTAMRAARGARFYPLWNGPSPETYSGYYPVVFESSGVKRKSDLVVFEVLPRLVRDWKGKHEIEFVNRDDSFIKEAGKIGLDAPLLQPIAEPLLEYPLRALGDLVEGTVWARVDVKKDGRVNKTRIIGATHMGLGFEGSAERFLKEAEFPIRTTKQGSISYDAYTRVDFYLTDSALVSLGYPLWHTAEPVACSDTPTVLWSLLAYPAGARQAGVSGTVRMNLLVDPEGMVHSARMDSTSGFVVLDAAALRDAPEVLFSPAFCNGQSVARWVEWRAVYDLTLKPTAGALDRSPKPGEFVAVEVQPEMIREAMPEYPRLAQMARLVGKVWVMALVGRDGFVRESRISRSSGHAMLDSAAVQSVRRCIYKPGVKNGKTVSVWVTYPIDFQLER